ncbi:hypothetical protein [Bdellovibrio reynosensis]|uniref:Collagen-like protein n=1 Tax=Bdellovibrio reynosensis TaxID=2835041 RepID=A0ABY4C4J0_9BACT|nr:hypothetical protein [Bdellovibrio reynosensis]UOE99884.1 hypothetical protein MNR06_09260 [Bdellovibrio reynosensis]
MKRKMIFLIILLHFGAFLLGCVEVRDNNETDSKKKVVPPATIEEDTSDDSIDSSAWVVDEPYYLIDGRWINQTEMDLIKSRPYQPGKYAFTFDTVKITHRGALYTQGHDVELKIKKLLSDDGTIATFPSSARAHVGITGKNGGHLVIKIEKAQGPTKIYLQGENGADGLAGNPPDATMKGIPGSVAEVYCKGSNNPSRESAAPGPGKKGHSGTNGTDGGNSGTLLLEIEDNTDVKLNIQKNAGRGGVGGQGGQGGAGGDPAKSKRKCEIAVYKKPGAVGPKGDNGLSGKNGIVQEYCIVTPEGAECH